MSVCETKKYFWKIKNLHRNYRKPFCYIRGDREQTSSQRKKGNHSLFFPLNCGAILWSNNNLIEVDFITIYLIWMEFCRMTFYTTGIELHKYVLTHIHSYTIAHSFTRPYISLSAVEWTSHTIVPMISVSTCRNIHTHTLAHNHHFPQGKFMVANMPLIIIIIHHSLHT